METNLASFTDILSDGIPDSQPLSLSSTNNSSQRTQSYAIEPTGAPSRPKKHAGQHGEFRSIEEIDPKYRGVFTYPYFNLVQSRVIEDALYSDKSIVVCAPTGSGKTVVFEMAIVQLLMEIDEKKYDKDFKIIYMAPVKALCTERLTEWYSKFTKLGLLCIEVTGDTDVDVSHLKPYRVIITTPEKWDMLTRRWRDHRGLVELIKLFLIDEVHILNDESRGPVLEAVVSRMKTIESSSQSEYRIEQLQRQYQSSQDINPTVFNDSPPPRIRFVAVSATVSNPEDVATWLGNKDKPAVYYKFGDECRPVKLKRVVEGYPCPDGTSIFKFDIILNYKLWPIIQKYHDGKPTLIFCNTRKSVALTAEALSREITISFNPDQRAKLTALASTIKNKKLQSLVLAGVGCHHAGLLYEERVNIENAFRNRDLPILITTTTLAMGVNLPAHLVIIKNTQQYVNGAYQEYSISTVLQMVGRAGRPQFDTEATAVIMTRMTDKPRYEALVCGSEPLQSYLHKRLPENLNSEAALGTVNDVAQCVQWLRSTFLYVRAARDPKRYLGLPNNAPNHLISKKIEELCVRAMNGLASAGLISMDEASCIQSTAAGRLMSIFYLDLETMKHIMKIEGSATLEQVLWVICESHELADMHLRVDERRCLNALNRNNAAPTIRFPMKGKISTRQMKLNCVIQAVLGCLPIPDASLHQEAMKIMRTADRICKCLVAYVTRPDLISGQPKFFSAVLNSLILAKCIAAHIWENSPYVSKQLKGIGPTFSTLLATAGKINFMLLEESHPRDLERIMNKGPPAGNVLRKQISLLPKYQITMTPVDEKVVTMQLSLLNRNYLAENMENLTAGERHKCYIIVGDSENHLLLFKSFQDKDFIGMYDGIIVHEIKRKHNFEHKIIVHCVSSLFVGIDAQCEYIFKDLDPAPIQVDVNSFYFNKDSPSNKARQKQTCITDIYKERKRRSNCDSEISQSKEKKKRESALAEKIKLLKESFGRASKEAKEELQKTAEISNKIVQVILSEDKNVPLENTDKLRHQLICCENTVENTDFTECKINKCNLSQCFEDINSEDLKMTDYIDDTKINDILKDIEGEISREENNVNYSDTQFNNRNIMYTRNHIENLKGKKLSNITKKPKKSNFNFPELLDKNVDLNEEEDEKCMNDTGFSETIKSHIDKYLQQTKLCSKTPDILMDTLIEDKLGTITKITDHDTENLISLPLDLSMEKNETIIKPVPMKSEFDINPIDLTKSDDAHLSTETKMDDKTKKSLTSSDACAPLLYSNKTITEEIDKNDHLNNIDNIVLYQNSKRDPSYTLQNTVHNDNRGVTLLPLQISKNYTAEYDIERQIIPINYHSNFYEIGNKKSTVGENKKSDCQSIFKTANDGFLMTETNDLNPKWNYIRNFSYSAMNVDISTRHSADHHVHVIKKIKVDLDVTEIVTHNNLKQDTNSVNNEDLLMLVPAVPGGVLRHTNFVPLFEPTRKSVTHRAQDNVSFERPVFVYQNYPVQNLEQNPYAGDLKNKEDKKLNADNEIIPKIQVCEPRMNYIQKDIFIPENQSNSIHCKQTDYYYAEQKISEENNVKSQSFLRTTDKKSFIVDNTETSENLQAQVRGTIPPEGKRPPIASTNIAYILPTSEFKSYVAVIKEEDKNWAETRHTETQNLAELNDIVISKISEAKVTKSDVKTVNFNTTENSKKGKLEDILQKYSQAFRTVKKEEEKLKSKMLQDKNEPQINTQNNKRPFKITDIDKIEPKLPPLLIAETPVYTTLSQNKEEENVISKIPVIVNTNVSTKETEIERREEVFSEEEIEPLTPIQSKDLITSDFKIDDSMLNPKTLLQCIGTDEPEIIPPPPEFSDLNYSPFEPVEKEDYNYESIVHNTSLDSYENFLNSPNHTYADFGVKSVRNSSNEVETILFNNTENRPWTITQSSDFRDGRPDRNSYTARRTKLNNFKFMNKEKLKIKHY